MTRRQKNGVDVVVLQVGAASGDEAIERAAAFLAKRQIPATYLYWTGGERVKVGVMGLRRYSVTFRVSRA